MEALQTPYRQNRQEEGENAGAIHLWHETPPAQPRAFLHTLGGLPQTPWGTLEKYIFEIDVKNPKSRLRIHPWRKRHNRPGSPGVHLDRVPKMSKAQVTTTQAPATTPAQKGAPAAPAQASPRFAMVQGFRPMAGSALFAHTAAFLELSGMEKGAHIPRATVARFMGDTAVKHHLNSTGFLEQSEKGVTVSSMGRDAFGMRSIDPELKAGFLDILSTGKTERKMPASFTNPIGIKAV